MKKEKEEASASSALICPECGMLTSVIFNFGRQDWHIEASCLHRIDIWSGQDLVKSGALLDFVRLLLTDRQADALAKYEEAING